MEKLSQQLSGYLEGMAQERECGLKTTAHGYLTADNALVRRALNLVANAIRYGQANTIVTLRCNTQTPKWLDIEVLNQGAAIGGEHLPRIFDRFYRCDDLAPIPMIQAVWASRLSTPSCSCTAAKCSSVARLKAPNLPCVSPGRFSTRGDPNRLNNPAPLRREVVVGVMPYKPFVRKLCRATCIKHHCSACSSCTAQ